jgi:hypothetical protein
MRLSDIMSAMHLSSYAEVALVLFMIAFAAIAVQVLRARESCTWERARHLPLEHEGAAVRAHDTHAAPSADIEMDRS